MGRGALVFKGGEQVAGKKKKKRSKHKLDGGEPRPAPPQGSSSHKPAPTAKPQQPQVEDGIGRITTSGTVVTGRNTSFTTQFRVGDALLVGSDMRVVTMVLSDVSINLSSAFAQNLKEPVQFSLIAKPRAPVVADTPQDLQKKKEEAEAHAFGSYTGSEVVYRRRTENGNYRIERQGTAADMSRTEMLELRSKKASDKYC